MFIRAALKNYLDVPERIDFGVFDGVRHQHFLAHGFLDILDVQTSADLRQFFVLRFIKKIYLVAES